MDCLFTVIQSDLPQIHFKSDTYFQYSQGVVVVAVAMGAAMVASMTEGRFWKDGMADGKTSNKEIEVLIAALLNYIADVH